MLGIINNNIYLFIDCIMDGIIDNPKKKILISIQWLPKSQVKNPNLIFYQENSSKKSFDIYK